PWRATGTAPTTPSTPAFKSSWTAASWKARSPTPAPAAPDRAAHASDAPPNPSTRSGTFGRGRRIRSSAVDQETLLERSQGPVTRSRISRDLAELGLRDGDVVMFHTRMSAIGYVAGGAPTVIAALRDAVGERGTLMVYCGWNDAPPYDFLTW